MRGVDFGQGHVETPFRPSGMGPQGVEHEAVFDPASELRADELHELCVFRERCSFRGLAHRAGLEESGHVTRDREKVLLETLIRRVELSLAEVFPELLFHEHEKNPGRVSRLDGPRSLDSRHPEQSGMLGGVRHEPAFHGLAEKLQAAGGVGKIELGPDVREPRWQVDFVLGF